MKRKWRSGRIGLTVPVDLRSSLVDLRSSLVDLGSN